MPDGFIRVLEYPFRKLMRDKGGYHAEVVESEPPADLMTNNNGDFRRLRVDVGSTSHWAGREFHSYYEFSITAGATRVIKIDADVSFFLINFGLSLDDSTLRLKYIVGGTEGGSFSTTLPYNCTNLTAEAPVTTPNITLSTGGTHSGGDVHDLMRVVVDAPGGKNTTSQVSDVLALGYPAGLFYITIDNIGSVTATGVINMRFEERP